jgi:lipoprotein-anchoring transpeptidase ErfK/SrfK
LSGWESINVVKFVAKRRVAVAAWVLTAAVLATACEPQASGKQAGTAGGGPSSGATTSAPSTPSSTPAVLSIAPADRSSDVAPTDPVTVSASSGTLEGVRLVDAGGNTVPGEVGPDGVWKASELLAPDTAYTLTAHAKGPSGSPSTVESSFRTIKPKVVATYGLIPGGGTVGVGMPVSVQFDSAVATKAQRAEVEKRVKVTMVPKQEGAWGWLDNRQLMWRPKNFWVPGTKVTVSTPLRGVQTGDNKWVGSNASTSFTVGSAMISTVDMRAHTMTVRQGGQVLRTFKVSTGRPGPTTETRYGTKVIISRDGDVTMDSATVGIPKGSPGYYKLDTKWAMRLTWTGEYIHSAPWSVGAQGSANVSHGCTNMAPADAQWMFEHSKVGDVVKFTGSNRPFQPTEGIGVWVYSFDGWKAQSALS